MQQTFNRHIGKGTKYVSYGMASIAAFIWSLWSSLFVLLSEQTNFFTFVLTESIFGFLALQAYVVTRKNKTTIEIEKRTRYRITVLVASVFFTLHNGCLFYAVETINPVEASTINYLWPSIMVSLYPLFGHRFIKKDFLTGVGVSIASFLGIFFYTIGFSDGFFEPSFGHFMALVAAISAPIYMQLVDRIKTKYSLPTAFIFRNIMVLSVAFLLLFYLTSRAFESQITIQSTWLSLGVAAVYGIVSYGLAEVLWVKSMTVRSKVNNDLVPNYSIGVIGNLGSTPI